MAQSLGFARSSILGVKLGTQDALAQQLSPKGVTMSVLLKHPKLQTPVVLPSAALSSSKPVVVGEKVFLDPTGFTPAILEQLNEQRRDLQFSGGGREPVVVGLSGHSGSSGHVATELNFALRLFLKERPDLILLAEGTRVTLENGGGLQQPDMWIVDLTTYLQASARQPPKVLTPQLNPLIMVEIGSPTDTIRVLNEEDRDKVKLALGVKEGIVARAMKYFRAGVKNVLIVDTDKRRTLLVREDGTVRLRKWDEVTTIDALPGFGVVMKAICNEQVLGKQKRDQKKRSIDAEAVFERFSEASKCGVTSSWEDLERASDEDSEWEVEETENVFAS